MLVGGASQVEMTCIEELLNRLKDDAELIKTLFHNISHIFQSLTSKPANQVSDPRERDLVLTKRQSTL